MGDENFSISDEIRAAKAEQLMRLKAQLFEQKTKSFDDNHDFTISHFLIRPRGSIAVMGAGDGSVCAEYARLKPHLQIIGLENNPQNVNKAQKNYKLPNLSIIQGDIEFIPFANESLHGILHAGTLHRLYSRTGYNITSVVNALRSQMNALKLGGLLVIRDYIMPPGNQFVLMEFLNDRGYGSNILDMSDADLLLRFSQTARPLDTNGCEGFFIEELKPREPETRLFRLPYKWAVEFIYRMDKRDRWDEELLQEYTFLTPEELSKQLDNLGVRTIYTGPHWDEDITKQIYQERFRLYTEEGKQIEYPPTTFITVAQKISSSEPVLIQERRPSKQSSAQKKFTIKSVRDESGIIHDFTDIANGTNDLIPYRITDDGRLYVLIRSGVPRPAVGAVPRGTPNLDGKIWSGFMFEPLVIPAGAGDERDNIIREILHELIALPFENVGESFSVTRYYPDPEKVASRIEAFAAEINLPKDSLRKISPNEARINPLNPGFIREFDAQDILRAIHVGLIPDTRLEIALISLMEQLGFTPDNLHKDTIHQVGKSNVNKILTPEDIEELSKQNVAYSVCEDRAGTIKHVRSVFVEEARIDGLATGVASHDYEMILPAKTSTNTVVILPLTVDSSSGEMMVGFEQRKLPVAHRLGGQSNLLQLPAFRLPENIATITEAKKFVAVQIKCSPEDIHQMGSSYFIHSETGPERIFPMTIYNPGKWTGQKMNFINYSFVNYLMQPLVDGPLRNKSTMGLMLKGKQQLQILSGYGLTPSDMVNSQQKALLREQSAQQQNTPFPTPKR